MRQSALPSALSCRRRSLSAASAVRSKTCSSCAVARSSQSNSSSPFRSPRFPRLRKPSSSLPEREIESRQQRPRLIVAARRRAYGDVHAPDIGHLVVIDLWENNVLTDAERVVAAPIEALRIEPAEVAHARQRNGDQPVKKLVHARLAQRHLAADRLAFAQFVGRDRFARRRDHRFLTSDQRKIGRRVLDLLAVVHGLANAHVDDDLIERRYLHDVRVAELLRELLPNDALVLLLQTWLQLSHRSRLLNAWRRAPSCR